MSKFGIDKIAQDAADAASASTLSRADWLKSRFPHWTPIELVFAVAVYHLNELDGFQGLSISQDKEILFDVALGKANGLPYFGVYIFHQCKIGPWRVDFAIAMGNEDRGPDWIIVECDGHEFHEKTKEQAAKDKARDRDLAARGFTVFHFTGSELYRDPMKCAREAIEHLMGMRR